MKTSLLTRLALASAMTLCASMASAGITLDGTRVVFAAPAKETSVVVRNQGSNDIMVQSWVEPDSSGPATDVPFAITPPLVRLGGSKQQILRILYQGQGLPTDKESVFWLAVQEIPQKAKDQNSLQIAIRQRVKLFYRPANLPDTAANAAKSLQWKLVEQGGKTALSVNNPSAYHVSFSGSAVKLRTGKDAGTYTAAAEMLAPGATRVVAIKGSPSVSSRAATVEFDSINDYGGLDRITSKLSN
ncbi:fimbrial biogenesis chaperone [Pseudomonas chlororaphis]|uniref:fimbrial biogenesis chaperone n=1 Tax=Pseudomonas chlororaphis TaxID=587753 RepID=UPI000F567A41|nr:molecular chaperone [Pseudomonas chlororaphis]AZC53310.1 putative pili assembly chaperone [Pseudomonas chlororaphis subsp. piscium]AZC59607.1 putative pili assembly chaperone [Pseudomonas chlororaphis subsp. piscium]AZC98069.1 putative pili assembly chaperone [Pseudomonas chlororaphis subsp. piscium]MBP5057018.1 molecular chaperone [Pseudomonas chlororaphis]MBP5139209.1 molecular chaperone [Pseudomonas chlororaphis]